jgi:2,3-dihydroxyphenylpropionate 1,2-dioxygenase
MPLMMACASHSPIMGDRNCLPEEYRAVRSAFAELSECVTAFAPELIIQFSPDHFNGFTYALMPTFCVGVAASSVGDFDTQQGAVAVPEETAVELSEFLVEQGLDIAISYRMRLDHGFVQIWENLFGTFDGLSLIPVFINCAAPPLCSFSRARLLGEAVGRFALSTGRRVLIAASGGLSHDPPVPRMTGPEADPAMREYLIDGHAMTPDAQRRHRDRIIGVGAKALEGTANIIPVSEDWDREFLACLCDGPPTAFDEWSIADLAKVAGRGGPEVLCWVAAASAVRQEGPLATRLHFYGALQGWIAGMAVLSGGAGTSNEVGAPSG